MLGGNAGGIVSRPGRLPLNAGELEALQKLRGKNAIFETSICSIIRLLSTFY